jgi:hypothetical protein
MKLPFLKKMNSIDKIRYLALVLVIIGSRLPWTEFIDHNKWDPTCPDDVQRIAHATILIGLTSIIYLLLKRGKRKFSELLLLTIGATVITGIPIFFFFELPLRMNFIRYSPGLYITAIGGCVLLITNYVELRALDSFPRFLVFIDSYIIEALRATKEKSKWPRFILITGVILIFVGSILPWAHMMSAECMNCPKVRFGIQRQGVYTFIIAVTLLPFLILEKGLPHRSYVLLRALASVAVISITSWVIVHYPESLYSGDEHNGPALALWATWFGGVIVFFSNLLEIRTSPLWPAHFLQLESKFFRGTQTLLSEILLPSFYFSVVYTMAGFPIALYLGAEINLRQNRINAAGFGVAIVGLAVGGTIGIISSAINLPFHKVFLHRVRLSRWYELVSMYALQIFLLLLPVITSLWFIVPFNSPHLLAAFILVVLTVLVSLAAGLAVGIGMSRVRFRR